MSIAIALREAAQRLAPLSGTARLDAELLMAHALGVSRSELLLRHLRDETPEGFADLAARRERQEPIAYITGQQEFYGRPFRVTPAVLIPRADSEATVGAALDACPAPDRVLDCGTGSGALLLTVLAERPASAGVGIDRSAAALGVARANARRLDCAGRSEWLLRDWHQTDWRDGLGQFDLVLANPPYVEADAKLEADVGEWEPGEALFAGPDGMDDYRVLIPQLPHLLATGGVAVIEIGSSQAEAVGRIARDCGFICELRRDLAGRPRALVMRFFLGK